jgi:hypothetical protein
VVLRHWGFFVRAFILLVLGVVLIACSNPPPPVDYRTLVPEVTIFGSDRILVRPEEPDGSQLVYQWSVTQEALATFMARAHRDLAGTGDEYVAMDVMDAVYHY